MKYSNYNRKRGFFAGKGFYIVLACCIIAVGVAAFSAVMTLDGSGTESAERPESSDFSSLAPQISSESENVGQTVSDVPVSSDTPVSSEPQTSSEPTTSTPKFALPIKNANVGKIFSESQLQYSETYGDMRLHLGVDLQAEKGTKVMAASSGTVLSVASDALWGNMITIDHGSGIVVYYCGLENTTIEKGETVSAGTVLGEVGSIPCESGDREHIHVAVTKDGKYISPLSLMK